MKRTLFLLFSLLSANVAFAQRDAIDLSQAVVHNSPADVASWSRTTSIRSITIRPSGSIDSGVALDFPAQQTWPDYTPPGWDGPLQYTVWAGVRISGVWHVSGIIQMWRGRVSTGAPILHRVPSCTIGGVLVTNRTDFACNWVYGGQWGTMMGYDPSPGEAMVFFVTAGNARGVTTVTSVRERSNVVMVNLPADDNGFFPFSSTSTRSASDFDGDGRSDFTVYRPGTGQWFTLPSSSNYSYAAATTTSWGQMGDYPVAADFDGDGRVDVAVYRPSNGYWFVKTAATSWSAPWGIPGDIPIAEDFDGDGKADLAIYRPSNGYWVFRYSSTGQFGQIQWGAPGDIPILADVDGDGKADIVVYRPSTGYWLAKFSSGGYAGYTALQWGAAGDIPLAADFDGDGKSDIAVYRPSSGAWLILLSSNGFSYGTGLAVAFGLTTDVPMPGDYDGDGKADVAVWRPSTGQWLVRYSSNGVTGDATWGSSGDVPTPTPIGAALARVSVTALVSTSGTTGTAGTPVTWVATAAGGLAPYSYKFYVFNGSSWSVGQDWSASSTWAWTPPAGGTYLVQVWVRNAGSEATYDAWLGSAPFVVAGGLPLAMQSLVANRTFPVSAGTPVTWTASATGGVGPYTYKFWVFNGTSWSVGQDWSESNSWVWTPPAAGAYNIQVWVRNAGSGATFDTWGAVGPISITP
jgi:hypothetical protein